MNAPDWIDVIWLLFTLLQNIKYVLNTMTIWDPKGKSEDANIPKDKGQREREQMRNNGPH